MTDSPRVNPTAPLVIDGQDIPLPESVAEILRASYFTARNRHLWTEADHARLDAVLRAVVTSAMMPAPKSLASNSRPRSTRLRGRHAAWRRRW